MKQYLDLMQKVMTTGVDIDDRTGVGTRSIVDASFRIDLSKGFPLLTTKKMFTRAVVGELIWFMLGSTNVEHLRRITHGEGSDKKTIWDDNYNHQAKALGYTDGYLGPVYGKQYRAFGNKRPVDQMEMVINEIKTNPLSRRLLVSAWNPEDLEYAALPSCHHCFQMFVRDGKLSLKFTMRSTDVFLGLPFNIASYALLTHIIASICNLEVGELIYSGGDVHIYRNHFDQCMEQLSRTPMPLCKLEMPKITDLSELRTLTVDDFKFVGYQSHPTIKAPMAV